MKKVMESNGISKAQKSTNPVSPSVVSQPSDRKQHVPFSSAFTDKIGLLFRITVVKQIRS